MDPMVGSSVADDGVISDSSDNAALLDFCFLCSRQFFHDNLDNYGTERLKDEDVLETFFEELGPVDRALLQCCPTCKALCKTLTTTKEALSSLINEITYLLMRSRKVSYLLSKSRVVSRLFQSSNLSLPPCEVSSSYLQQPLSQINFPKDISTNNSNNCFPTQFHLGLDSSNMSDEGHLDLSLSQSNNSSIAISGMHMSKKPSLLKSPIRNKSDFNQEMSVSCSSTFTSLYNDSMMNCDSDNACDISEEVNMGQQAYKSINMGLPKTSSHVNILKETIGLSPDVHLSTSNKSETLTPSLKPATPRKPPKFNGEVDFNNTEIEKGGNKIAYETVSASVNRVTDTRISICVKRKAECARLDNNTKATQIQKSLVSSKVKKKATKFKCTLCKKSFQNARNLKNHLSAHRQERPFICEMCGVSYRHKVGLDNHVAVHKGEPKFKCDKCSKTFSQNIGLQRHLRIHMKKFKYFCDTCGKQFLHHTSFKSHQLIHTGVKNFACPDCDLTFLQKSNLQRHLRVHTGEKPHSCSLCRRSFSQRYNLIAHMKSHEDSTAVHKCSLCSKTYTRKFKLKQHAKHIHNIVLP